MAERRRNAKKSQQSKQNDSLHKGKESEEMKRRIIKKLEKINKLRIKLAALQQEKGFGDGQLRVYEEIKDLLKEMLQRAEAAEAAKKA